jgi:hypothetical protein
LALSVLGTNILGGKNYVASLSLQYFMNATLEALLSLVPLTYLPNYFDILPMYMGGLLLIPIAMLLARIHPFVGFAYLVSRIKSLPWQAAAKHAESKPQPVPDG